MSGSWVPQWIQSLYSAGPVASPRPDSGAGGYIYDPQTRRVVGGPSLLDQAIEETRDRRPTNSPSHAELEAARERELSRQARILRYEAEVARLARRRAAAAAAANTMVRAMAAAHPWIRGAQLVQLTVDMARRLYNEQDPNSDEWSEVVNNPQTVVPSTGLVLGDFAQVGQCEATGFPPSGYVDDRVIDISNADQPPGLWNTVKCDIWDPVAYPNLAGTPARHMLTGWLVQPNQNAIRAGRIWSTPDGSQKTSTAGSAQPAPDKRQVAYPEKEIKPDNNGAPDPRRWAFPWTQPIFRPALWRQPSPRRSELRMRVPFRWTLPHLSPWFVANGATRSPAWPLQKRTPDPDPRPQNQTPVIVDRRGNLSESVIDATDPVMFRPDSHKYRHAGKRVKERKVRTRGYILARLLLGLATESMDTIGALWKALPSHLRQGNRRNVSSMLRDLWNHWDRVDMREAAFNWMADQVQDTIIGQSNRWMHRRALNAGYGGMTNPFSDIQNVTQGNRYGAGDSEAINQGNMWAWIDTLTNAAKWHGGWERDPADLRRLQQSVAASGFAGQDAYRREIARRQADAARRAYHRSIRENR